MKRKASLLLIVSAMALSGCWFTDLFKKKNNEPEQGEKDDPKEKYITGIVQVLAPSSIEQGTALTSVQVKVSYSDGSQDVVTSTRVEIDTNTVGTATGTAYVNNFSASFSVEVYSSNIPTHHGVFSTYGTEDVAGDGYIDFKLKNESEDKIEVRAEKVAYEGNVPKAKKDSYFVLFNKLNSPLNDVYDISFSWSHAQYIDYEELIFTAYFSYNYLTLDDIFAGYYSDLDTHIETLNVGGTSYSRSLRDEDIYSSNARYFLIVVQTPSVDLSLMSMQVTSNNDNAPASIAKGTYAYPSEASGKFLGFPENSFPFVGNGSVVFDFSDTNPTVAAFQKEGKIEWLNSQLSSNGFTYATELIGLQVYQKPSSNNKYYTIAVQTKSFCGFDAFSLMSAGEMESLIEQDAWPEEDIKSAILSDEFKALIIEPVIEQQVSYTSHIEQTGGKNSAGVLVNVKDEGDEAYVACSNSLKDYVMSFVTNHGFVIEYESGEIKGNSFYYALRVRTTDLKFGVELSIMYGGDFRILTLTFVENIFGPFPSNEVRILYENDSFPVLNNTASGQFSYSVSSSSDEISITAINVSHEELVAYLSSLKDYGFSLSESDYADYHRYSANKMEITSSGAYQFYVSVNEYENYITLSYRKSEAYTENSLSYIVNKLLSYSFRSLGEDFTDALDSSFEDGEYIADYTNNIIYCMGFGQTEKDLILSVCKYDSLLNAYFFSDEENPSRGAFRIDVEVNSNHLVLQIREISSSTWQNYNNENATNNFNLLIDELFTDASSSDTPSDYYFSMNSCKFLRSWYSIYAYGNNVKDIVETYKSVLLGNSNIKYSKYLDQYINVETGTAVRFNMSLDMSIPYVAIEFSFNVDFVDYAKFSDIASSLTPFTYLNLYPSIPNAIGADSEACVFDYAYTTSASIYLIEEAYEAYKNAVMNDANFASPYDGSFERVDEEGNRARVMFSDYIYEVSFSYDESYYTSISDITASYEIDSFDFASNFVLPQDSGKIFRDSGHWGSYFSIEYAPSAFNKNAYISALNGAGFVESGVDYGDEVIYAKVVGTTSYYVKISNNTIQFSSVSYSSLLSYAELCEELEDDAFDIKKLDRFVTIPGMENNYFYSDGWGNQFTVLIADGSVTIDAYRNALINAGFEYNSQENAYILGETNVSISLCYGFLKIKFYDKRIIYRSMAEVIEQAKKQYFEEWRLAYMELPNQSGDLYCLDYAYTNYITFYYDKDNFDVDAYKEQLIDAGYTQTGSSSYEKGEAQVYLYSDSISVSYNGSNS